ncbi:MAG: class I SAM-dependent methyltransferase [Candidatus Hydrogenedentes bacterium]|nr:class I SAM-dependent methyltransferase [Candidatus Hydrogenedentota bacterium]
MTQATPQSPVPSLCHVQPKVVYDFETKTPVYSSCGVPTSSVQIFECPGSGTRFRIPPSPKELTQLHDQGYQKFYGEGTPELAAAHSEKLAERVGFLCQYLKEGRVLDVGCSTGLLMQELTQMGFDPFGCDVSSEACSSTSARFNAEKVCHGNVVDALHAFGKETFDAITLMDVIEHFHDAGAELTAIRDLLKPEGLLFLRTPTLASPFFHIADWSYRLSAGYYKKAVQTIYHAEHIYFFSEKGLRMLLEESGFEVLTVVADPLPWRTFRLAELNHSLPVNTALALVYFLSRALGSGHGIKIMARRKL